MKRTSILGYQIRKMLVENMVVLVLCSLLILAMGSIDQTYIVRIDYGLMMLIVLPVTCMSLREYINFGFCRKKYYREQIVVCGIRAMFYAVIRSTIHTIFYKDFVTDLIAGTDGNASLYHPVSFVELFLGDFLGCYLLFLFMFVTNSFLVSFAVSVNTTERTPQLLYRRTEKKKKQKGLYKITVVIKKCIGFILLVAAMVGLQRYYVFQLQSEWKTRMLVIGGLAVLCVVFYLYGKRRYQPKYV